jgi:hypothetical protein
VPAAEVLSAVHLRIDDVVRATDSVLSGDSLVLVLPTEHDLSRGDRVTLTLVCDIQSAAPLGNYLISFSDSTFMRMTDKNLATAVYPLLASGTFPVWSAELSVTHAGLRSSFSNYPNPFVPESGPTTFAYDLTEDAHLDIEIFTTTGRAVREVVRDAFRSAGTSYNDLTWDGRNDAGHDVAPGAYLCRVTARYVSGREETFLRKVALVR